MSINVSQVVQNTSIQSGSATTATVGITVAAGSTIHGLVVWNNGGSVTLSSVTDGTNTYTILDQFNGTAGSLFVTHFYATNVAAGTFTISANFSSAAGQRYIAAKEIRGASPASLDKHTGQLQATPTTTTNATTSGATATLSQQPALASGWCVSTQYSGSTDLAGTSPAYTGDLSQALTTTGKFIVGENLRVTSTAGNAATFTSAGNFEHVSLIAVFDEGTGHPWTLYRKARPNTLLRM